MKILCIGNVAYDITFPLEHYPIENNKYKAKDKIECGGGTCANSATLLSKWGMDVYFAGRVGNDIYGKRIINEFDEVGVNYKYLQIDDRETTISYIIVNKENGSRTIISTNSISDSMDVIDIDIIPDIILIDGKEYEMSKKIINKYPSAISIIDASNVKNSIEELCTMCNYVVCSKNYMKNVCGIELDSLDNIKSGIEYLENKYNTNIIVTLEDKGCAYRDSNSNIVIVPGISMTAIDTTGAGDIFHGAFTYGIANNWDMDKILKFSNVAGGLSVSRYGGRNSIFNLEEVEEKYNEIK